MKTAKVDPITSPTQRAASSVLAAPRHHRTKSANGQKNRPPQGPCTVPNTLEGYRD